MKYEDMSKSDVVMMAVIFLILSVILATIFEILNPTLIDVGFFEYFNRSMEIDVPFTFIMGLLGTMAIGVLYFRSMSMK